MAPGIGRADEKPLKRVSAKARPGLCHRAGRHHPTVSTGQRKLEPVHDFRQRLVSHQRHAHYQPDDLLCGQPPPSNRGRSRGGKCFLYPLGGQPLTNAVKMARRDRRQIGKRLAETRRFRDAHNRILILRTGNATTLPTVAKSVRKIDLLRLNRSVLSLTPRLGWGVANVRDIARAAVPSLGGPPACSQAPPTASPSCGAEENPRSRPPPPLPTLRPARPRSPPP